MKSLLRLPGFVMHTWPVSTAVGAVGSAPCLVVLMQADGAAEAFRFTTCVRPRNREASLSGTLSGRLARGGAVSSLLLLASASILPCQRLCLRLRNCVVRHGKEKVYSSIP